MSVTIHQLAKAAGVSIATVSRVLNKANHPVNEETRQRILQMAEEMGYHPNQVARSLRTERSGMIGIIADDISSTPFSPLIIRGIQDYVTSSGYFCIIINADWNPEKEKEAVRDLLNRSIDGVIFAETWHNTINIELDVENKPYVFVHRLFSNSSAYSVIPDEIYGARQAVNHLLELGHRRIGYINGPDTYHASAERFKGYQLELEEMGIAFDPALTTLGNWDVGGGYEAAKQLLANPVRPTAIFAANDLMALGAIYAIQDAKLRVPEDVAIVGYDDREIASIARPAITTVTLPCYDMGQASAAMLLNLLEGKAGNAEEIKIRGRLLVRQSCGAQGGNS